MNKYGANQSESNEYNPNKYERLNEERKNNAGKRKVAAYCRVSTDKEDQANSFASQRLYFKRYIENHLDWELYEIFADEGISGTNTKKRKEFKRMIDCAKNGDFDLILTKEISRFARNTLDSIYYTRDLKKHGVGVIFVNDNINTLDPDAELRLAILSSIAQEESRKTSERVKWGQKRRMEQGVVFGRSMLGYDVRNGKMYLNEDGAKIIRRIFHKFVREKKERTSSPGNSGKKTSNQCRRKNGKVPLSCASFETKSTAATWYSKKHIRRISFRMRKNITTDRKNLSLSEIIMNQSFPGNYSSRLIEFWPPAPARKKEYPNTAAAIRFPEKSNVDAVIPAMSHDTKREKTAAAIRLGAVSKP